MGRTGIMGAPWRSLKSQEQFWRCCITEGFLEKRDFTFKTWVAVYAALLYVISYFIFITVVWGERFIGGEIGNREAKWPAGGSTGQVLDSGSTDRDLSSDRSWSSCCLVVPLPHNIKHIKGYTRFPFNVSLI